MAINMMCMNGRCVHYWEDNCMRNIMEEHIEIDENGKCETFEVGVNKMYLEEENCSKRDIEIRDIFLQNIFANKVDTCSENN